MSIKISLQRERPPAPAPARWRCALLLAVVAACQVDTFAPLPETGGVKGHICDPNTQKLAQGAAVSAPGLGGDATTTTDATGAFELTKVQVGAQTLRVVGKDQSFETTIPVTIISGKVTTLPLPACLSAPKGKVTGRICAVESKVGSGEGYWLAGAEVSIVDAA